MITSALTAATVTAAAMRRGQRSPVPPGPRPVVAPPQQLPEPSAPTDAGRWQGEQLEGLPRQPLYTIAASRGVPERRLTHMSREEILAMLVGHDASHA